MIARLDTSQFQAQLAQANASWTNAQAAVQSAQANVLAMEGAVQAAQANVERTQATRGERAADLRPDEAVSGLQGSGGHGPTERRRRH